MPPEVVWLKGGAGRAAALASVTVSALLALSGCGGMSHSHEKETQLSGNQLEPGEAAEQGEETKHEEAELAKNRELLSLLESKRREETAELNASEKEKQAGKKAKKREAAAAKKAAEAEKAARNKIKQQEAALRSKIAHEQQEREAQPKTGTTQAQKKSPGEPSHTSEQSVPAEPSGN
jgi:hypothetical protein